METLSVHWEHFGIWAVSPGFSPCSKSGRAGTWMPLPYARWVPYPVDCTLFGGLFLSVKGLFVCVRKCWSRFCPIVKWNPILGPQNVPESEILFAGQLCYWVTSNPDVLSHSLSSSPPPLSLSPLLLFALISVSPASFPLLFLIPYSFHFQTAALLVTVSIWLLSLTY